MANSKFKRRAKVKARIRGKISGTTERPRLSVFRSNKHIYAQLIDDSQGRTVAAASTAEQGLDEGSPVEAGRAVGRKLAERAVEAGHSSVVFDRNGYRYHGRVLALAEGAREGGLAF